MAGIADLYTARCLKT